MKSVISALLIFIFIIVGSFASYRYVNDVIDEMLQSLYKNEIFISKNFWDESKNETKNLEEYRDKVSPIMASLMEKYGISEGEEDSLLEKIQNSEAQRQNENPQSVQNEDRIGALRQRAEGWARESLELKNTYPDFDLRKELRGNKLFATLLMGGAPVRAAFETVHRDELLSGAMAYTADKVREEVVRSSQAYCIRKAIRYSLGDSPV